jgi:hypothetical protein
VAGHGEGVRQEHEQRLRRDDAVRRQRGALRVRRGHPEEERDAACRAGEGREPPHPSCLNEPTSAAAPASTAAARSGGETPSTR